MPLEPKLSFPGLALAYSTSSLRFLTGRDGRTSNTYGNLRDQRDRREILDRVVVELLVKAGADGERRRTEKDGVTVGPRLRHKFDADVAAGAGTVFRHHRLAEPFGKLLSDDASQNIGRPARRHTAG